MFTAGIALQLFSFIIMPHLCAEYGCGHISKREKGKFQFFFISFCIVALGRRNEKQHTQQQQQQQQSFIHTIQVPGEVEKRKKLQKTK